MVATGLGSGITTPLSNRMNGINYISGPENTGSIPT